MRISTRRTRVQINDTCNNFSGVIQQEMSQAQVLILFHNTGVSKTMGFSIPMFNFISSLYSMNLWHFNNSKCICRCS